MVEADTNRLSGKKQLITLVSMFSKRTHLKRPNIPISISERHKLRMNMRVELLPPVVNFVANNTMLLTTTTMPEKTHNPIRICRCVS